MYKKSHKPRFFYRVVCGVNLPSNQIIVKKIQFYPDKKNLSCNYSRENVGSGLVIQQFHKKI
jgi:hypothetical protein